jgi:hypothetical protein
MKLTAMWGVITTSYFIDRIYSFIFFKKSADIESVWGRIKPWTPNTAGDEARVQWQHQPLTYR